jgi:hypothetical protein
MCTAATFEQRIEEQAQEEPKSPNLVAKRLLDIHALQDELTSSPHSHDALELALATATSLPISRQDDTALVWLLIAGAPAPDKTNTAMLLRDAPTAYFLDTLTENSFVSGYIDPDGKRAKSLLPELNEKCLVIKDLTTLFSMKEDKVKKILGDLQSIYDGEYAKYMGTVGMVSYDSVFSVLACITSVALAKHHRYMSLIGGRFLTYGFAPLTDEERREGFAISWGLENRKGKTEQLRQRVTEHIQHLQGSSVTLSGETEMRRGVINSLATLLGRGRAVIHRSKYDPEGQYEIEEVQIEEPWRVLQQLCNLGRALARVHGRASITDHELELLRRVVLASMPVDRAEVLSLFRQYPEGVN